MTRHVLHLVALVASAGFWLASVPVPIGQTRPSSTMSPSDWPTFGHDPERSSASSAATAIDAATVPSLRRQQVQIDGTVDASAIYLRGVQVKGATHDTLFMTTTYGKTIAMDASDGTILWEYTPAGYGSWAGSYRITTATPVADDDRSSVYAASPDGHIQKLAISDGHAVWSTAITRLPEREKIASALNFFRGRVLAATGGYIGDRPPYQGHVAVLDGTSGKLLHVWNSLCSDRSDLIEPRSCGESGGAIWGRAGVVVDPASGNMFAATGNGRWDGRTNWGDSLVELNADATLAGNYTPQNTAQLSDDDQDLGSTSPVLLGGNLVAQGGKDARIRLLDLQRIKGTAPHRGGETQSVPTPSDTDLFTAPAVVRLTNETWLFAADNGATAAFVLRGGRLEQKWRTERPGTSPVVAGGLLYVYSPRGGMHVYQPETGREIAALDCGKGHWNSPIVTDGRLVLPEGNANAHQTTGVVNIWRVGRTR